MSEIETHIGKLKRINFLSKNEEQFADIDVEEWIKDKCLKENIIKQPYDETWLEAWNEEHYCEKGYIIESNGEYYEIIEDENIEENDIQQINQKDNNTFEYLMRFYNGGTCLPEMLEESINNLRK